MKKDDFSLYNKKHDFTKTSEPVGKLFHNKKFSYLIQKHEARRLHYDFRLELNGTLKSWAVNKGPSLDPHVKRLAVEVEDHPVSYSDFEGTIPHEKYGGDTAMLWDKGKWRPQGNPEEDLKKGRLNFQLLGKRLRGSWSLVRMKNYERGKNNWLLIKKEDEYALEDDSDRLIEEEVFGHKMKKIAKNNKKLWNYNENNFAKKEISKEIIDDVSLKPNKTIKNEISQNIPLNFIAPQLATLSEEMPKKGKWIHEIKFDGYRSMALIEKGKVRILTRNGLDWSEKYRGVIKELKKLPVENAILDGEIVALDDKKRSNFLALQEALKTGKNQNLQYYVFDILFLNNEHITSWPLIKRKEKLEKILRERKLSNVFYSAHFNADKKLFGKLCSLNYEGIISKLYDQPYSSGRSKDWLKLKCHKRQEFVIGGYTLQDKEDNLGALLVGYYKDKDLIYVGKVGTGFGIELGKDILKKLKKLIIKQSPFLKLTIIGKRNAIFVEPTLVCEVEFTQWTKADALRHPSFQGLRADKLPQQIHKEVEISPDELPNENKNSIIKKFQKKSSEGSIISSIKITDPQRIIYPKFNLTKIDLANYYDQIANYILPYVENRLISVVLCPEGLNAQCFFQRHENIDSKFIHELKINDKDISYIYIKDKEGLLTLIQDGVIEIHTWNSKINDVHTPDRIVFDLDPDTEVSWKNVVESAADIKLRMDDLGLESFLRTTGGKGLHVVIPIKAHYDFEVIKAFTKAFATKMASDQPHLYIVNMNKEKRKGKIFIDYLRNELTSTAITSFAVRSREDATIAMPLRWEELNYNLNPKEFNLTNISKILEKAKANPWKNLFDNKQSITKKMLKKFQIEVD